MTITPHVLAAPSTLQSFVDKKPDCADDDTTLCARVWETTHKGWLAASSDWFVARPAAIIAITLGALLIRWLVNRAIYRVTRGGNGKTPAILRPLKERGGLGDANGNGLLSERRRQRARTVASVLRSVSSAIIFAMAMLLIADQLSLDLAPLLASAGIAGVALGFGAQTLVKDYLAGIFMMLEDQYGVGDVVNLGTASGTVEAVGLRTTTVRDLQGAVWYVRNGEVVRVGNLSQGWARAVVDIPVPFGTDLKRANEVIRAVATAVAEDEEWRAEMLEAPEILGVNEVSSTGMMLRATIKTTSSAQWKVVRELRARITSAFAEAGIPSGWPVEPTPTNDVVDPPRPATP